MDFKHAGMLMYSYACCYLMCTYKFDLVHWFLQFSVKSLEVSCSTSTAYGGGYLSGVHSLPVVDAFSKILCN